MPSALRIGSARTARATAGFMRAALRRSLKGPASSTVTLTGPGAGDLRALALVVGEEPGDRLPGVAQPVAAQGDEVAAGGLLGHDDTVGGEEGGDGQAEGPNDQRAAGRLGPRRTGAGRGAPGARWRRIG